MADRADFAPELGALKSLRPFVFWAQTTLPTVFDDSLSYYEVLTKLTKMVNTLLENEDTNAENIAALAEAYQELEDFTNNYFENLDVTQEINDKLDELVADGTIGGYVVERATTLFNDYLYGEDGESGKNKEINDMISEAQTDIEEALANFATRSNLAVTTFETNSAASIRTFEGRVDQELAGVSTIVEDWMDANFTNPSSVVIDDTLTTKDAAAEAYATGKLMDDATNMVLATSYWQDYVVDSVSGSFILADVSGGSNPAVGTGAPSMTLYVANVTPGETYIVSGVASSYSTTRYIPAYALGNLTYDASDNPYYEFYDVYPRGWDESQDPGTVYRYVRNQTVRIPTGTTPTVTHLFIVGDSRVPITVRCSRLNARTDTALTSETLPAQGKATGDALDTKIPWPVSGGNKDLGTAGYGLVTNADGTTSWQEVGGDYDEEIENLQNDVLDLKSALYADFPHTIKKFAYGQTPSAPYDDFNTFPVNELVYVFFNTVTQNSPDSTKGLAVMTLPFATNNAFKVQYATVIVSNTATAPIFYYARYYNGTQWTAWEAFYKNKSMIRSIENYPYGTTPIAPYDNVNTFPYNTIAYGHSANNVANLPSTGGYTIYTMSGLNEGYGAGVQIAINQSTGKVYIRTSLSAGNYNAWSELATSNSTEKTYTVNPSDNLVAVLNTARSQGNAKIIINGGTHDMLSEYGIENDTVFPEGFDFIGAKIGNNIKLQGVNGAKLIANYTGDNSNVKSLFSILNIVGSCEISGIDFECTNVRYCIHDECGAYGQSSPYLRVKYTDCYMKHNGSNGSYQSSTCIGAGTFMASEHIVEKCVFESPSTYPYPVTYHNNPIRNNVTANAKITICNSALKNGTLRLYNYAPTGNSISVLFCNNATNAEIYIEGASDRFNITQFNNTVSN